MEQEKIGLIGLGKLGLPVALAMGSKGHHVLAYDASDKSEYIEKPHLYPYVEAGIDASLDNDHFTFTQLLEEYPPELAKSPEQVAKECRLIFVSVQTPHSPEYDGTHPLPATRRDFDYFYLKNAVGNLSGHVTRDHTIVIISTVMPGTIRRDILPMWQDDYRPNIVYNPYFIAMGTVIPDFLDPEFILVGTEFITRRVAGNGCVPSRSGTAAGDRLYPEWQKRRTQVLRDFYNTIYDGHADERMQIMSYESAELTKVAYNTFIGFKIALANLYGELAEKIPNADGDDVMDALKKATDRLISPAYLTPGMGDGGGCHPRDLIAMSWLCNQTGISGLDNPFDDVMRWRENHARRLAALLIDARKNTGLTIGLCGYAFKANTGMVDGSHALLLRRILSMSGEEVEAWDPYRQRHLDDMTRFFSVPRIFFLGVKHDQFITTHIRGGKDEHVVLEGVLDDYLKPGSIVIDPFRYYGQVTTRSDIRVISLGRFWQW